MENNAFFFEKSHHINDTLDWFEQLLLRSHLEKNGIIFDFKYPKESLSLVKKMILLHKDVICFENLFFFNANDFINLILQKPIYLPTNINLFINEWCFIGCVYCDNKNITHKTLSFQDIQTFLSKYPISDTMNFNILWQGDPLFHPELFEILEYIKSFWAHITFFSGWKSILYCKDTERLNSLVDEFKINLSSSNTEIYNKMHTLHITQEDFHELVLRLKILNKKITLITILKKDNIADLIPLYKLAIEIGCFALEIKRDVFYPKDDIFSNKSIEISVIVLIKKLIALWNIHVISNIIDTSQLSRIKYDITVYSLLERIIGEEILNEIIPNLNTCHQFWNSLDITEKWIISVCCHYEDGKIWMISDTDRFYNTEFFAKKYTDYATKTPKNCKNCPMPLDRNKNYIKAKFVENL